LGGLFELGDVRVIGAWAIEPLRFFLRASYIHSAFRLVSDLTNVLTQQKPAKPQKNEFNPGITYRE